MLARSYESWWYDDEEASVYWEALDGKQKGVTDAQGRWVGVITPHVRSFSDYRHSVPLLIEATVRDDQRACHRDSARCSG